ncbi:AtpZ/AtpI family protein [Tranquillimonas alkanivorans]|uniref:ATP synthase protein I n=1 Tax=Tranquillimonas alkanivorans TaxID=441119 RepID=A0A1I5TH59_9RHOB|nr:AtpZ/AtpI family protein [Tranquillimonas alkanivorans]SFP81736.1 ATP synthase protein I [Tranquillimonas alkanivorans]
MADDPDKARMRALEERIAKAKKAQEPAPRSESHYSHGELAWRMVIELTAGLMIGLGIGYGLDVLFGTLPVFLVLFVLLGFAAGVKTMLRTAKSVQLGHDEADQPADGDERN